LQKVLLIEFFLEPAGDCALGFDRPSASPLAFMADHISASLMAKAWCTIKWREGTCGDLGDGRNPAGIYMA
jgi:hypothetical protein